MRLFMEQLLNGVAMGSIYALVTLGLALVYGIMRILHVAHAAVYTIGAYVGLLIFNMTGSLLIAFPGAMIPTLCSLNRKHCYTALCRRGMQAYSRALYPHIPCEAPFP
jgi:branched-chain amino acid transport system permease protein